MKFSACLCVCLLALLAGCTDDSTKPKTDSIPPGAVSDLAIQDSSGNAVTLTWTAPGDDGTDGQAARYDLRCSQSVLTETGWEEANVADSSMVPKIAGLVETLTVGGLADGSWFFGMKTADEVPNWSALSNVICTTLVDSVAPGAIADLAIVSVTASSVGLSWTAPGDDEHVGQAAEYDLRYAETEITQETWEAATQVADEPVPGTAGAPESFTVTGLEATTLYYFALKTTDGAGNWSEISNLVSEQTIQWVRLTTSPDGTNGASRPRWSPDGERIVFLADWESENYYADLYLIPAEGGTAVRLADDPDRVTHPSWSPNGTRVAFVMDPGNGHTIYTRMASPGAIRTEVIRPGVEVSGCTWSPVEDRIAYLINHFPTPSWQIYAVPSTGGTPELLLTSHDRISGLFAWSPDGTQLAFASDQDENYDIWTLPASGGAPVRLTDEPGYDLAPVWSPDGSRIAFYSDRSGSGNIWLMSPTGESPTQLTFEPEDRPPSPDSWSPDGSRLAVTFTEIVGGIPKNDIWILYLE